MMKSWKKRLLALMLAAFMPLLCACHENPSQEELYSKLFAHFENYCYECRLQPVEEGTAVPIYKASAWQKMLLNEEELLVYFDDSNRADYLSETIDEAIYGRVTCFGLRFILVYPGSDAGVLKALDAIVNE